MASTDACSHARGCQPILSAEDPSFGHDFSPPMPRHQLNTSGHISGDLQARD